MASRHWVRVTAVLALVAGGVLVLRTHRVTDLDAQPFENRQADVVAPDSLPQTQLDPVAGEPLAAPPAAERALIQSVGSESANPPQRILTGSVVRPPGTPVTEEVRIAIKKPVDKELESVPVGADGSFTYSVPSKVKVVCLDVVAKYLYLPRAVRVELRALEESVVLEPILGGRILGTVTGPRNLRPEDPVVGMRVSAGVPVPGAAMDFVSREAFVDEHLKFVLPALPAGNVAVAISCHPYILVDGGGSTTVPAQVYAGRDCHVVVPLGEGAFVSGAIDPALCAEASDDARALVRVCPILEDGKQSAEFDLIDISDGCTFSIGPLEPGDYKLRVAWPNKVPQERSVHGLAAGEDRNVGTLTFESGASFHGTVVFSDHSPASKAWVFVHDPASTPRPGWFAKFESSNIHESFEDLTCAQANDSGEFQVAGLGRGPWTVVAVGRREPVAECARLEDVGISAGPISIVLAPAALLTVQVTTGSGAKLGSAYVGAT